MWNNYLERQNRKFAKESTISEVPKVTEKDLTKIFESTKKEYCSRKWAISYMKVKYVNQCIMTNGKVHPTMNSLECAGSWTVNKTVCIGTPDHLQNVMKHRNVEMTVLAFGNMILRHESGHEVWKNILKDSDRDLWNDKIPIDFTTPYLDTYNKDHPKYDEERFCEWLESGN